MHQGWARAQPRRTPLGRGPRGVSHGPVMEALALLLPLLLLLLRDASSRDVKGERERPPLFVCVRQFFGFFSVIPRHAANE
jgi:hypothetical protein